MKMERINAWLGFSGNIAILLGLVFLAIEINGNTKAVRVQVMDNQEAVVRERQLLIAGNPEIRAIYVKSLYSPSELMPEELWAMSAFLNYRIGSIQTAFWRYKDGVLSRADWEDRVRATRYFLGGSFGRVYWSMIKDDYSDNPEFVAAVDGELTDTSVMADDEWLLKFQETVLNADL